MDDPAIIDSYFVRETQYQKLLQSISAKHEQKYTKKLKRKIGGTDKDDRENYVKELERELQVKSKSSVSNVPSIGSKTSLSRHASRSKGFQSRTYAPIAQESYYWSQSQWDGSAHQIGHFRKATHCIFDMDGTVIDSESQYHKILKELCAGYGKKYTKELEAKNFGATDQVICENVVNDLQLNISTTQLQHELKNLTKVRLPKAPLKKGIERLFSHLYRSGVTFALATNSTRRDVRLHINTKPKIFGMFHHIVCVGDPDVYRGKPFPDLYLIAAAKFPDKPSPNECLVFEDSLVGLEAGLAAGMQVIMTPPRNLTRRDCAAATLVLNSVLDFKPELFGLPPFNVKTVHKNKPRFPKF